MHVSDMTLASLVLSLIYGFATPPLLHLLSEAIGAAEKIL